MTSLAQAVALHQAGDFGQAASLYHAILASEQDNPDVLHLLGVLCSEQGRLQEANDLIERALRFKPNEPIYLANYGLALARAGRLEAAAEAYKGSLRLRPSDATTLLKLSRVLIRLERYPDAAVELGAYLELQPDDAEAWFERANALHKTGSAKEAIRCYRRAVSLRDDLREAWYNLGVALMMDHQTTQARRAYQKALFLDPSNAVARNNLGHLLQDAGEFESAIECYQRAIRDRPDFLEARYNLAVTLQTQERFEDAVAAYEDLLAHEPSHADARNNLGGICLSLGEIEQARSHYQQALHIQPDHPDAAWNIALIRLQTGDFEQGWREYELRLRQKTFPWRDFAAPLWKGESLDGRTILVWAEQGLGDTVQFSRYVYLLAARGARVVFECQPRLVPLLRTIEGIEVVSKGSSLPHFDCHIPLLSLPDRFGTRLDSIPPSTTVSIPDSRRQSWRERLSRGVFKIGLNWAGNPASKTGKLRSILPSLLACLADDPGVTLYSLQRGMDGEVPFQRLEQDGHDILDTAAIISELDLVITVDTMIAHLAGTLGCPVWTLLPFAADWRWLLDRGDSPWYPTMRLFRQQKLNDWPSLILQVKQELEHVLHTAHH